MTCCRASGLGSLGAPQTRLWSEIRDHFDRHGAGAVKADTFPRYKKKAPEMGPFLCVGRVAELVRGYQSGQFFAGVVTSVGLRRLLVTTMKRPNRALGENR